MRFILQKNKLYLPQPSVPKKKHELPPIFLKKEKKIIPNRQSFDELLEPKELEVKENGDVDKS